MANGHRITAIRDEHPYAPNREYAQHNPPGRLEAIHPGEYK